jgi:flagellar biosynthesis/type III secretory pathway protein FliH
MLVQGGEQLRELFPTSEYNEVIDTVEEIQMKTEYRELYDARQKAKLDEAWRIAAAERKGRKEGHQEGREEGREEGELFGKLRMLQTLLNQTPFTDEALKSKTPRELKELAVEYQAQLRSRLG